MSFRFRTSALIGMMLLAACSRDQRQSDDKSFSTDVPAGTEPGLLKAGGQTNLRPDPAQAGYEHNAAALSEGQRL